MIIANSKMGKNFIIIFEYYDNNLANAEKMQKIIDEAKANNISVEDFITTSYSSIATNFSLGLFAPDIHYSANYLKGTSYNYFNAFDKYAPQEGSWRLFDIINYNFRVYSNTGDLIIDLGISREQNSLDNYGEAIVNSIMEYYNSNDNINLLSDIIF